MTRPGPRVLYLAVQDPSYPRNHRIRTYLEDSTAAWVDVVGLSSRTGYLRHAWDLLREVNRKRGKYDFIVLSEFSLPFAPIAWYAAKRFRAALIVDFFIGLYETHVEDRKAVAPNSAKGRLYNAFDRFAIARADLVLTDTEVRAARLSAAYRTRGPVMSLPVGAPTWARPAAVRDRASGSATRYLYYGNYIPLHGIDVLIESFASLDPRFEHSVTMLGDGEDRAAAEAAVAHFGLESRFSFIGPVAESDLRDVIVNHDVILGVFGDSVKASSVIANKVWQGLACGKHVVTRQSPALDELAPVVGSQLIQAADGSAGAIARALTSAAVGAEVPASDVAYKLESYVQSKYLSLGAWIYQRTS